MKLTAISAAVALVLSAANTSVAVAAEECKPAELEQAKAACLGTVDTTDCLTSRLSKACLATLDKHENANLLPRVTVVGTRFGIDVDKYPGSASVLVAEELDDYTDILQALKKVPGIDTGNDYGRSLGQQFSIRGFGHGSESRVILMQDGVRRSANLFANQISNLGIDSDLLKTVDVVRGSSGISYGGGAIGGVIGTTTKDATDFILPGRDIGMTANYRFDSNSSNQGYAALAAAPEGKAYEFLAFVKYGVKDDLLQAGSLRNQYGRYRNVTENHEEMTTGFLKAGWNFSEGHKLTLSYFDYRMDVRTGWNSLYHASTSGTNGAVLGDRQQQDTVLRYVFNPAENPWLDLTVSAYTTESFYERSYERGVDLYYRNQDERWGFSAQNLMQFATGTVSHRLLLGLDYENRQEDGIYILNGVRTSFNSMPNEYRDLGVFIQHESLWLQDRLAVQLGGRYDQFEREVLGVAEDYDNNRFSPRVGLSYEWVPGFNLLANYSEAFRAPTPHETSSEGPLNIHYWYQPNPDLQPETSAEYEAGFSWNRRGLFRDGDRFRVKSMYFDGRIDNMIRLVVDYGSVSPADSEYVRYENVDGVTRKGVELEMSYDQDRWGTHFSFETLDMKDRTTGQKTPSAFADRARLGFSLRPFEDDFTLSMDTTYWFKPDQDPETLVSGGVTYWYVREAFNQTNLQMRWRPTVSHVPFFDGSTQFLAGINNVFDQKRLNAAVVETNTRTGLGRNLYFSITKMF